MASILLTGVTGVVGSATLSAALSNPDVASITLLTRRAVPIPLTGSLDRNISTIILKDFSNYSHEIIDQLRAQRLTGIIWCVGGPHDGIDVHLGFTEVLLALLDKIVPLETELRFVYISGALVVRDQQASLWFFSEGRKMRGLVEERILSEGKKRKELGWSTFVARPALVMASRPRILSTRISPGQGMWIDKKSLGEALVKIAISGHEEDLVENKLLRQIGWKCINAKRGDY